MVTKVNEVQEETPIRDLINLDIKWFEIWYGEENRLWRIEKIRESIIQSIMETVLNYDGEDYEDYRDIKLVPEDVESVVLNMESIDDTYKINGYDRNNVLNYYRSFGYTH